MKKLYGILKIIIWGFIGTFIGSSIYQYIDYKMHRDLYALRSAPWYLGIELQGIFTAVIIIVILVIMAVIKKKMK